MAPPDLYTKPTLRVNGHTKSESNYVFDCPVNPGQGSTLQEKNWFKKWIIQATNNWIVKSYSQ